MRLVVATCSVTYVGRLRATLPLATRLLLVKADGSISIHSDDRAYKPLNWMNPPCNILEEPGRWTVSNRKGESLVIELHEVHSDTSHELGVDPGLSKDGVESQLQELLGLDPTVIEPGLRLVRREYETGIGPVDLLCHDAEGRPVAIEVKRVLELSAVDQLSRYLERLRLDGRLAMVRGVLVAETIKPQAATLARDRGIGCVQVDYGRLCGDRTAELTLF